MKILRTVLLTALALLLSLSLIACPYPYETVMQYKDTNLPEDVYRYWLSCYRAQFWDRETDSNRAALREEADLNIQKSLIAAGIFDTLGLSLNAVAERQIAAAMERLVSSAGGTREELDTLAATYGVGYDGLKIAITYEQKALALRDYLFGENGAYPVTAEDKEDYYQEHYTRVRVLTVLTVDFLLDDNGDRIYDPRTQSYLYTALTGDALAAKEEKIAAIEKALSYEMTDTAFLSLMERYDEDSVREKYPSGYYFSPAEDYTGYIREIPAAAFSMSEGETRRVESEWGVHFLYCLPCDEGGYAKEENADFFGGFDSLLRQHLFERYITVYLPGVTVKGGLADSIRWEDVTPNFDLYW